MRCLENKWQHKLTDRKMQKFWIMAEKWQLPLIQKAEENTSLQIQKQQMTALLENWPCPCCYLMYAVKNQNAKAAQTPVVIRNSKLPLNLPFLQLFIHMVWVIQKLSNFNQTGKLEQGCSVGNLIQLGISIALTYISTCRYWCRWLEVCTVNELNDAKWLNKFLAITALIVL